MAQTNPERVEQVRQILGKIADLPPGLNRRERRALQALKFTAGKPNARIMAPITDVHVLTQTDPLLEEDDLMICRQELSDYEQAQAATRQDLMRYRVYRAIGVPDPSIRAFYINMLTIRDPVNMPVGGETSLWLQADPRKIQQNKSLMAIYERSRDAFLKKVGGRIIRDEESEEVAKALMELEGISMTDTYQEILRARAERIELIKLQIDWLETHQAAEEISPAQQPTQPDQTRKPSLEVTELVQPVIQALEQDYLLSGWNLFWTKTHWSQDAHHLVAIPTTSRTDTVASLTEVARGEISVKPDSIIRALEFHLQKDIVQRALATRNKYGPEGIRDWVKMKRGRDRIFFIPHIDQHLAIFFAGGRDMIYRNT